MSAKAFKILKLKPTCHVKADGPIEIEVLRVKIKWVWLRVSFDKGTKVKWGRNEVNADDE